MYDKKRYRGELFNTGAKRIEGDFPGMFDVLMVFGRKKKSMFFKILFLFLFSFSFWFLFNKKKKTKKKLFNFFFKTFIVFVSFGCSRIE